MKKICKKVYETPFIEIVPMENNLMENALSKINDGYGGSHDFGKDDAEGRDGMGKEFGFESYGEDWGNINFEDE